jgi:hypothetical protein
VPAVKLDIEITENTKGKSHGGDKKQQQLGAEAARNP